MKGIIFISIAVMILAVLSSANLVGLPVSEAKCAMPAFAAEYEKSEAVFVGTVEESRKTGDKKHFVFEAKRFWKGVTGKYVKLTVSENMRYQSQFEEGKTYLVFAKKNEDDGELFDGRCSRSAEIGGYSGTLEDDIEELGPARTCIDLDEENGRSEDNQ